MLELEWMTVGLYICQPWSLFKQEQYLIIEHYDCRVGCGNFSIGFL